MSASRWLLAALSALALGLGPASEAAAAGPSIGTLGVGGTGCPAGTVSAALSANGAVLSLKFSRYRAAARGARSFDRKACGISIPFTAPPGKSVAIVGVQLKGKSSLPSGATGTISAETFFAGDTGPVVTKTLKGTSGAFNFSTVGVTPVWSDCGGSLNLRVNTSIKVQTSGGKAASVTVRSQDVAAAIVYQLVYRAC
jgi:hypothetical protein